jgi:subtilisin family serine protease
VDVPVTVAIVDTGADATHPLLTGRVVGATTDPNGHGTHLAGIVARMTRGRPVTIDAVRALDADAAGDASTVAAGIRQAVADGADVIDLSLSLAAPDADVAAALAEAAAAGAVTVCAAGNGGGIVSPPADNPNCLAVGAADTDGWVPAWSATGPAVRLVARGVEVTSGWPAALSDGRRRVRMRSGTSQAAAEVSGALASLMSHGVAAYAAVTTLLATARDVGAPGPDPRAGSGLLDLKAASRALFGTNPASVAASRPTSSASRTLGATVRGDARPRPRRNRSAVLGWNRRAPAPQRQAAARTSSGFGAV